MKHIENCTYDEVDKGQIIMLLNDKWYVGRYIFPIYNKELLSSKVYMFFSLDEENQPDGNLVFFTKHETINFYRKEHNADIYVVKSLSELYELQDFDIIKDYEYDDFVTIDCGHYKLMVSDGQGDSYQSDNKRVNFYETQNWVDKNCNEIKLGGYNDWVVPTKGELNLLYENEDLFKGNDAFYDNIYWSSSETSATDAWRQNFYYGNQSNDDKANYYYVRAVRRINP